MPNVMRRERDSRVDSLTASVAGIAFVVLLALAQLAWRGNWPKAERMAAAYVANAALLLWLAGRHPCASHAPPAFTPPFWAFAAALLVGGVHWLGLARWARQERARGEARRG